MSRYPVRLNDFTLIAVRINKQQTFTKGRAHINGSVVFWNFAKFDGVKGQLLFPAQRM